MKLHTYILIIVFLLSASFNTVSAEPPPAQKLPNINGALTDYAETKFGGTEAIDIFAGTTFGFELQDIILPIYKKAQQIAAPDFKPLGIGTMQTFNKYLISDAFTDKIIHYSDINENIATTIFCAVIRNRSKYGKNALTITKSGVQKSSNFEDSQEAFENLRTSNSIIGLSEVTPNKEGFLDFNLPSMYHPPGTAKCGKQYTSEEDKPVENDVTELASWGGGTDTVDVTNCCETLWDEIIKWLANGVKQVTYILKKFYPSYEAVLTENTRPSNFEQLAHAGDANEKDVDNAADEETKKLAKSRGLAFAYLPEEKSTDPNEHAGKTEYSYNIKSISLKGNDVFDGENGGIEHPWLLVNNAKFRTCQMARSVVPDGLSTGKSIGDGSKGDIVLDEKCPEATPTPPAQCPIDIIEKGLVKTSPLCSLKNTGAYTSSNTYLTDLEKSSLKNGIPPLMKKVLDAAGAAYNVPASLLLGTMLEEGSFEHAGTWDWTDETVKKYSDCTVKDPMPSCRTFADDTSEGATGPFGYITNWWQNYIETGGPYKAYENDPAWKDALSKAKPNFNECNFTDAAFTAARELGEDQDHYQKAYDPIAPIICNIGGTTYNTFVESVANSCTDWNADRVAMARMQYGDRTCTEGVNRMVKTYKGF